MDAYQADGGHDHTSQNHTHTDGKNGFYSDYADINRIVFSNRRGEKFPIRAGLETDVRIVLDRKPIIFYLLKKLDFIS